MACLVALRIHLRERDTVPRQRRGNQIHRRQQRLALRIAGEKPLGLRVRHRLIGRKLALARARQAGNAPPRISSKVDVWSVGVILFQALFGKRPYGDGQTQEKLLSDQTILKAQHVDFPPKPAISEQAKEFVRACLTHRQNDRPNVMEACQLPYLKHKLR